MIIFNSDFQTQGAFPDFGTRNNSFVRYALLLKEMGVKSHLWPLALYQRDLINVDPFNPKLTEEQKLMVAVECKINPMYYFREIVRVPMAGTESTMFVANRANMAHIWCFLNSIDTYLTIPRQIGKTVGTQTIVSWLVFIAGRFINIGLFAKSGALTQENVSRLKIIRDSLPPYLVNKSVDDTNNKEGLDYKALGNKYDTYIAQADRKAAESQARGQSYTIIHHDEIVYYTNNFLSYNQAVSTTDAASEQARQNGIPAANLITSTVGDLTNPTGIFAYSIVSNCMRFREDLYDCKSKDDLLNVLSANSTNRTLYIEFNYKQLGKDEEWFKRVTRGKSQREIDIDYLQKWYTGSATNIIPEKLIVAMMSGIKEPIHCNLFETLMLRWYVSKEVMASSAFRNKSFLLGSDTSDNIGSDFTTLVMIDPSDMSTVMTCRCNISNLVYMANCIVKLLVDFPGCVWIPERNKNGATIVDIVIIQLEGRKIDPFARIYNNIYQDKTDTFNSRDLELSELRVRKAFGFTTTATTREVLFQDIMLTAIETAAPRMFDQDIVNEAKALTIKKGRIDHQDGAHDDTLVAWLLACWLLMRGKNLHLYGIHPEDVLNSVTTTGSTVNPEVKRKHTGIGIRIKELKHELEHPHLMSHIRNLFERELKNLELIYNPELTTNNMIAVQQVEEKIEAESPRISLLSSDGQPTHILTKFF